MDQDAVDRVPDARPSCSDSNNLMTGHTVSDVFRLIPCARHCWSQHSGNSLIPFTHFIDEETELQVFLSYLPRVTQQVSPKSTS